ncbi:MAG: AI-2E family transporter [Akkermansia sp.]|nr:AI-2E family transporter [Akkermansia sp.]
MSMKEKEVPTAFQRNVCWLALSSVCLVVMVALLCACVCGIGWLFVTLQPVLLPVIVAGILAYLLSPAVKWVQKLVKKRIPAVLIVLLVAALAVGGLAMTVVPPLVRQTSELVNNRQRILESSVAAGRELLQENHMVQNAVDTLYERTLSDLGEADERRFAQLTYEQKVIAIIDYNSDYLVDKGLTWLTAGTRAIYGASAFLIGAVMVPVFLFYFLLESEAIARNWDKVLPLRASQFKDEVVGTLQEINQNIVAFVRGQMLVSLIDGVLLCIILMSLGLPYAITIAAAAALLGIIPYIGMISTSIPALLIAWFTWHDVTMVVAVGAAFLAVSQLDGWVIQPRVVGNTMKMHDMTVMFSVLFWSMVFGGVIGALLAVPLTASIKVLFRRYVWGSFASKTKDSPQLTQ